MDNKRQKTLTHRSDKCIKIVEKGDYRLFAISDIHGHPNLLEQAIKSIELTPKDYLVIVGDFINRGKDSIETYNQIKKLAERPRTIVLKGNHELFMEHFLSDQSEYDNLLRYLKEGFYETIASSFIQKSRIDLNRIRDGKSLYEQTLHYFKGLIEEIRVLPIILKFNEMVFVHGGYHADWPEDTEEHRYLKYDFYNDLSDINEKRVVVGHWPACNLRSHLYSNLPYSNDQKHILFIDGGLGVKETGELNVYCFERQNGIEKESYKQFDHFTEKKIIKAHTFVEEPLIFVNYPHYDFYVVEPGEFMTKCLHVHSQQEFSVFNELLVENGDMVTLKVDYINRFFNLKVGETVKLVSEFETCALVKSGDEFGWILRDQIL